MSTWGLFLLSLVRPRLVSLPATHFGSAGRPISKIYRYEIVSHPPRYALQLSSSNFFFLPRKTSLVPPLPSAAPVMGSFQGHLLGAERKREENSKLLRLFSPPPLVRIIQAYTEQSPSGDRRGVKYKHNTAHLQQKQQGLCWCGPPHAAQSRAAEPPPFRVMPDADHAERFSQTFSSRRVQTKW